MSPLATDQRQGVRQAAGNPEADSRELGLPALLASSRLSPRMRRVVRYLLTSGASTVISEVTLLTLLGLRLAPAVPASITATATGGLLSYLLSRYWIWPEADRRRPGLQLVEYWAVTVAGLVLSAAITGTVAAHASGPHPLQVAEAGAAYFATYATLWVAKFVLYHRLIFRPVPAAS